MVELGRSEPLKEAELGWAETRPTRSTLASHATSVRRLTSLGGRQTWPMSTPSATGHVIMHSSGTVSGAPEYTNELLTSPVAMQYPVVPLCGQ
jgi:hypothetical protein